MALMGEGLIGTWVFVGAGAEGSGGRSGWTGPLP